ncbi:MAG: transcriptional regulator NrdR [Halobacteriovoraceae bacterium]|nr:transcriptional regulator NrdR [Halobacteriovoraceae bacterium]
MKCPNCHEPDTKVIDSRLLQEGDNIRRRRKCESCEFRFTTYEKIEQQLPILIKRDGRLEAFNREKIKNGLFKASQKRPITATQIEAIIEELESKMLQSGLKEYPTDKVGPFIISRLYELDHVAYVRFASFYWNFETVDMFIKDLQSTADNSRPEASLN